MRKSKFFVTLVILSAVAVLFDLFYIGYAVVQLGFAGSGSAFLPPTFESLSIFAVIVNVSMAVLWAIYLILRLILKKNI